MKGMRFSELDKSPQMLIHSLCPLTHISKCKRLDKQSCHREGNTFEGEEDFDLEIEGIEMMEL